jgi:Ca2+-binding RTX toxin-like protein
MKPQFTLTARKLAATATVAFGLAALAPAAASADNPVRPIGNAIAERGVRDDAHKIYVHGTNGADDIAIAANNDSIRVLSLNGRYLRAGAGCAQSTRTVAVCPNGGYALAFLYNGQDRLIVRGSARRAAVRTEVWGGEHSDVLQAEAGSPRVTPTLLSGNGDDKLVGSEFTENLWGGPGNDYIRSGGGADTIDGGHGFMRRVYRPHDAECAVRTHGFWDRYYDRTPGPEGYDTLDLSNLRHGARADLNICRLTYFAGREVATVWGIERVVGTMYNDRLVGDDDNNSLTGLAGNDWLTGEEGADRINSRDGRVDTIRCSSSDTYNWDSLERRLGC